MKGYNRLSLRDMAKPGDLLFYRVTPDSSLSCRVIAALELIRGEGKGPLQYSHVAILETDKDTIIEARWPRVRTAKVNWEDPDLELWRHPMTTPTALAVLIAARSHIGDMYDIMGLIFGALDSKHREICTTLVAKSFASMDITLGAGAGDILTPNELIRSPALHRIGQVCYERPK